MMKKILLIFMAISFFGQFGFAQKKKVAEKSERQVWLAYMDKVCRPVMENLAADKLKEALPVELSKRTDNKDFRTKVAYLEAFGRTYAGIAPWLELEGGVAEEVALRNHYRDWTLKGLANAVNPSAKDYMIWDHGGQPLVDASFLAMGLVKNPWVWQHLDSTVKQHVVDALKSTRNIVPVYSNWLLFSGMIETFFCKYGFEYDKVRVDYCIREFSNHWYVGDGMFSDGMNFAVDYYNSFVIQPYLLVIVTEAAKHTKSYDAFVPKLDAITKRYAEILERSITADGSYPATGRSIVYRGAAFQLLADKAARQELPKSLSPAQVRCALGAVIKRTLDCPRTFNTSGWLTIGVCGSQPDLADFYNNTGSLYICSAIFLPLGLSESNEFWSAPTAPWSAVKIWGGQDTPGDHALHF
jgi:hypothetical protein